MRTVDENILRAAKEIVVKFIETGRISPTGFPEVFKTVYQTVHETVNASMPVAMVEKPAAKPKKNKRG